MAPAQNAPHFHSRLATVLEKFQFALSVVIALLIAPAEKNEIFQSLLKKGKPLM